MTIEDILEAKPALEKLSNFIGSNTPPNLSITGDFLRKGELILDIIAYPDQNATYPFGRTNGQASFLYFIIVIKGDDNNGITFTIPRWVMENYYSPFYLDVTDIIASGYSAKADGRVYNYQIEIRDVVTTGWSKIFINVFGIY